MAYTESYGNKPVGYNVCIFAKKKKEIFKKYLLPSKNGMEWKISFP